MSHQCWGQEGLYKPEEKERHVAAMPDTLLMDLSGLVGSRGATEWWRAAGDSTKVQQYANNSLSLLARAWQSFRRRFLWSHVLTMQTIPSWATTELPGTGNSSLSPSGFILFLLLLLIARAGSCTCTLFPVASVDVGAVLLQFLSAQGEILGGIFSLLCSL